METQPIQPTAAKQTHDKKLYRAPILTNHGSAAKLTQGQGTLATDGSSGGKKKK